MATPNLRRGPTNIVLSDTDAELYELASLAGVIMQPRVFEFV